MRFMRTHRWLRLVAALLLFTTVRLPHVDLDDAACAPVPSGAYAAHDETQHALGTAKHDTTDHCALCHWTRTLRSSRPQSTGSIADSPRLAHLAGGAVAARPGATPASLPARAPPSTPL
jgi:hypothetical protein